MKERMLKLINMSSRIKRIIVPLLFVILIPPVFSVILGYQMNAKQVQHVPTVIVDHDRSSFSQMLINEIKTNEIFNVTHYGENDSEVKNLIEEEKAYVGVIIPQSFSKDLVDGKSPKVLIVYDGSQMSITSAAKSRMTEIFLTIKTGYLQKVMQGKLGVMPAVSKNNVLPMYFSYRLLNNPTKNYVNFFIPGMLIGIAQVTFAIFGVEIVRGDEKHYLWIWLKDILGAMICAGSMLLTLWIQFKYFKVPYRGSLMGGFILTIVFAMDMVSFGSLLRIIRRKKMGSVRWATTIVSPTTLFGGYTFPVIAMPIFFQKLTYIIPFTHYGDAMRDLSLKNIDIKYVLYDIKWCLGFLVSVWILSLIMFTLRNYWAKNKGIKQETEEVMQV